MSNPSPKIIRIAIPTKDKKGLDDVVSVIFSKSSTFTIVEADEEGVVKNVEIIENPAASYRHGAGPIAVKMLADLKVDVAVASELGIGASTLLDEHRILTVKVRAGTKVSKALEKVLSEIKRHGPLKA